MPRVLIGLWVAAAAAILPASAWSELTGASAESDDLDAVPAEALAAPRSEDDQEDALDPPSPHPRISPERVMAMERQAVKKRASASHEVMEQFMHNFARNMRYSILADSKGDMPEAERQAMLRQLREGGAVPPDADPAGPEVVQAPRARRHVHRGRPRRPQEAVGMLNAHSRSRGADRASRQDVMLRRRGGHPRHAREHNEHERHFDSLLERLNACQTKECVRALWDEASHGQPRPGRASRAVAAAAEEEEDEDDEASRGQGRAAGATAAEPRDPAAPRLLLFGGRRPRGFGQPGAQSRREGDEPDENPKSLREKDTPSALHAGLVGAAIGAVVALAAFLIASWLGP